MRFRLHLRRLGRFNQLPINYQYELSSWIYKTIQYADPVFSDWLHKKGYVVKGKQFKLFTFAQLRFPNGTYMVERDRIVMKGEHCHLDVSLCVAEAAQHFILGIFKKQKFGLGDTKSQVDFEVGRIERLPSPAWEEVNHFWALSPICVARGEKGEDGKLRQQYLSPNDENYADMLQQNLIKKWMAFQGVEAGKSGMSLGTDAFIFNCLSSPRSKLVTIKVGTPQETKVRGYLYEFELSASKELLDLAYFCGLGEKNSQGFGCLGWRKRGDY